MFIVIESKNDDRHYCTYCTTKGFCLTKGSWISFYESVVVLVECVKCIDGNVGLVVRRNWKSLAGIWWSISFGKWIIDFISVSHVIRIKGWGGRIRLLVLWMVFICEVYWWFGVEYNVTSFFFNFDIYFNSLYCISRNGNNTSRIG